MKSTPPAQERLSIQKSLPALLETTSDCIFFKDNGLKYIYVNPAMGRLFGRSCDDLIGLSDDELFGSEAGEVIRGMDQRVLDGEIVQEEHSKPVRGEMRRFRVTKQPVRDHAGRIIGLCGIATDISDLMHAENAKLSSEARYRALVEHVPIGLFRSTPDGTVLDANPALLKMLGFSSLEEIAGRNLDEECFGRRYNRVEFQRRLEQEGEFVGLETPWVRGDGTTIFMRENVRVVRDADGRVRYHEGSVEDITDRVMVERELRKVLNQTELALWGADLAAWDWHVPTGTLVFSQRMTEILGSTANELPLHIRAYSDLIHPDDAPAVEHSIRAHLKGLSPFYDSEHRLRTRQDGWRWVLTRGKAVEHDAHGRVCRVTGTLLDVTARKEAERALIEHQNLLHAVIEGTDDAIFVKDREGRYALVNSANAAIHGRSPREVLGRTDVELFTPDIAKIVQASDHAVIAKGRGQVYELPLARRDGTLRTYLVSKSPQRSPSGEIIGVIGIARDITDRKRAEEALREAHDDLEERVRQRTAQLAEAVARLQQEIVERRHAVRQLAQRTRQLQSLADHSPDLIIRVNHEYKHVFVNQRACVFSGFPKERLLGKSMRELELPAEMCDYWEDLYGEVFRRGAPFESVFSHESADGPRQYQVRLVPEFDAEGRVDTVLSTARDITEFKHAQEKLRRSERLASIGTLAAGIAHEINNPTGGILMAAQAALDESQDTDYVRKCLQEIIEDARRCGHIVKSVLRFSRQEPTEKNLNDINSLIRHATDLTQEIVRRHEGRLELDLDEALTDVNLNPTEIEQVLINLIQNAMEIGEKGTHVKVSTRRTDNLLRLCVSDNGPGMNPDQVARIFDPFYTTRQYKGGTGLGLSVVHGIIQAHGGRIEVESAPAAGTTFIINLPCS